MGILFSSFSSVIQYSPRANSLFVCLCKLPSRFSAPLKINYFICISFISLPLNCSATLNTKILSLLEGRLFIKYFCYTATFRQTLRLYKARICKPFKEPRNRFPAWRNRLLGFINLYKYWRAGQAGNRFLGSLKG